MLLAMLICICRRNGKSAEELNFCAYKWESLFNVCSRLLIPMAQSIPRQPAGMLCPKVGAMRIASNRSPKRCSYQCPFPEMRRGESSFRPKRLLAALELFLGFLIRIWACFRRLAYGCRFENAEPYEIGFGVIPTLALWCFSDAIVMNAFRRAQDAAPSKYRIQLK